MSSAPTYVPARPCGHLYERPSRHGRRARARPNSNGPRDMLRRGCCETRLHGLHDQTRTDRGAHPQVPHSIDVSGYPQAWVSGLLTTRRRALSPYRGILMKGP
jgi:hypothetical protein